MITIKELTDKENVSKMAELIDVPERKLLILFDLLYIFDEDLIVWVKDYTN